MKNSLKFYLLISVCLSVVMPAQLFANDCTGCHGEVEAKSRRGRVVHQPVMKGQCRQCHIAGDAVSALVNKPQAADKQNAENIRWFQTLGQREQQHWVRVPATRLVRGLFLRATDGQLRSPIEKVAFLADGQVEQVSDDRQIPQQTGLQVTDVRRGISTTATLQWETDKYTESVIYYGIDNLRSVTSDRQLARRHTKILLGLERDKQYQYQVVSRDLFGNEVKSPVLSFTTDRSFWNQDASYSDSGSFGSAIELQWDVKQIGDDYLLIVEAGRPVSLSLGEQNRIENLPTEERQVAATENFSHPVLKSRFDTNITVCKTCHQDLREEYSHPIKVRPKRGMVIPPEYPILSDGTMSCMTCHDSHASDQEYRLRKSKKAELCRGCHRNY